MNPIHTLTPTGSSGINGLETNIFKVCNLEELSAPYRIFKVRGLAPGHTEYHANCQRLKLKLTYLLKNPVAVMTRGEDTLLFVRDDADLKLPEKIGLVGAKVMFDPQGETLQLDFCQRSPENDALALRFLQFYAQVPLMRDELWRPNAGAPFYLKTPHRSEDDIGLYEGFSIRSVITPDGGMGFSVDATYRCISLLSLPPDLTREDFNRHLRGRSLIYHCGHDWFRIRADNLEDFNVSEYDIDREDGSISLFDWVTQQTREPLPPEVRDLSPDCAVVTYSNTRGQVRAAPNTLCHRLLDTHDGPAARMHRHTIPHPHERRLKARDFVYTNLRRWRFGDAWIQVSPEPMVVAKRQFVTPDFMFGHEQVLSVRETLGARQISLDNLGRERLAMLKDPNAGFFSDEPLDRQFFLMPESVHRSWGKLFLADLTRRVDALYPQENGYCPEVVIYNDRGPKTMVHQGNAILRAVKELPERSGFAAVMIHTTSGRKARQEDELAAMVVREFQELNLNAAVLHCAMGEQCYAWQAGKQGGGRYELRANKKGSFSGYLGGVALNTVLLNNHKWPFMLASRTHADITIGIDVKHNTAGLVAVGHNGGVVRYFSKTSSQKERLDAEQLRAYLVEVITDEAQSRAELGIEPLQTIVLHRDGRAFDSECQGAEKAMAMLKHKGLVAPDASLTILAIPKQSPSPLRLYDRCDRDGQPFIQNPQIGSYYLVGENEGYICSTGRAFRHPGTVRPLHIQRVQGDLAMDKCLQDIYFLTALAWTRPEDCTRLPVTIKLNDRALGDEATRYDQDALLAYDPEENQNEDDENKEEDTT